jgi:hypothetical protein
MNTERRPWSIVIFQCLVIMLCHSSGWANVNVCKASASEEQEKRCNYNDETARTTNKASANPQKCTSVIVTPNSTGLYHDAAIFAQYLGSEIKGFEESSSPECLVKIFLERTPTSMKAMHGEEEGSPVIHGDWISSTSPSRSSRTWTMVNPDQFHRAILLEPSLELLLCKTRQCVNWMKQARIKHDRQDIGVLYIGFTSITIVDVDDDYDGNYNAKAATSRQDYNKVLHVAGKSPFKGTLAVLQAWLHNPQWPTLTLCSYDNMSLNHVLSEFFQQGHKLPSNINHINRKLPLDEISELQYTHGVHLCPSGMEGFGHYINEARAIGAAIISTNHPAMNEFFLPVDDERSTTSTTNAATSAILVDPLQLVEWSQDGVSVAVVDAAGIAKAFNQLLSMSVKERAAMGARAKAAFRKDRMRLEAQMSRLQCVVLACNKREQLARCVEDCGLVWE